MIREDYVGFEPAKILKEKGFEGRMHTFYTEEGTEMESAYVVPSNFFPIYRPTLQMAMKWLREVHHLHISIEMGFNVDNHQYYFFSPSICKFSSKTGEYQTPFGETEFDTYEEAAEAAIKYCLEKLILI